MAQLPGGSFNAAEHGEMKNFGALPDGDYLLRIFESEMLPTKAKTGEFLKLSIHVMTPEFEGRQLFVNLNLNNPNANAVAIAGQELGAICRAVGKPVIQDSSELHGIPFIGEVRYDPPTPAVEETTITKAKKAYPAGNTIMGYSQAAPGQAGPAAEGAAKPAKPKAEPDSEPKAEPKAEPGVSQVQPPSPDTPAADSGEKPPWA